jgi:hypothetical protein
MNDTMHLVRGAAASTREHALRAGLETYTQSNYTGAYMPDGPFFNLLRGEEAPQMSGSEEWAQNLVNNAAREGDTLIPYTIDLTVTAENFGPLANKISRATPHPEEVWDMPTITRIGTFDQLQRQGGEFTVRMSDLAHEDLIAFKARVGFLNDEGTFDYKDYKTWTEELGVRAETRAEMDEKFEKYREGRERRV